MSDYVKIGVISEGGGQVNKIVMQEIERLYDIADDHKKITKELETHLNQNEKLIQMNLELSRDEKELKRSAKRVLNFYESFRLKALHLMDDNEIKESHDCLTELNELLESE